MANNGCEVHRFDPSIKSAHIQEGRHLWYHRLSIDWRDPNPAIAAHKLHSNTKKLGTILNEFGHQKIDVLKADVESAEWKILENLILEDVVEQIGQLVFEVHIHWPGFEVSGNDSTVVRYWYSLLRELELKDFRLFHTYKDLSKPQMFLKKEAFNASSCYTLSWPFLLPQLPHPLLPRAGPCAGSSILTGSQEAARGGENKHRSSSLQAGKASK
ncbi:methyltransferase-like protein 24 isoform X6 [Tyto alba]|nr:methyltransferase-like protein 24 isoform X6 [Tyto alba]